MNLIGNIFQLDDIFINNKHTKCKKHASIRDTDAFTSNGGSVNHVEGSCCLETEADISIKNSRASFLCCKDSK